jgi:hypothetical protein
MGNYRLLTLYYIIGGTGGRGGSRTAPTNFLALPVKDLIQLFVLDHEGQVMRG